MGDGSQQYMRFRQKKRHPQVSKLVRMGGFEPPQPCGHMALNHARLPVPPHSQVVENDGFEPSTPCTSSKCSPTELILHSCKKHCILKTPLVSRYYGGLFAALSRLFKAEKRVWHQYEYGTPVNDYDPPPYARDTVP